MEAKNILTFDEACQYTGFSRSYLYKLTSANIIPFSKPNGKRIFFSKEKLDAWLLSNPSAGSHERDQKASTYVTTH